MKQYEVLKEKELFPGSDIVRKISCKTACAGETMPIFSKRIVLYAAHHRMQ